MMAMMILLKTKHTIYQVYMLEKKDDMYEIWIEGQPNPIYEKVEDVELICK